MYKKKTLRSLNVALTETAMLMLNEKELSIFEDVIKVINKTYFEIYNSVVILKLQTETCLKFESA